MSSHLRKDHKIKSTLTDYFNQNDTIGKSHRDLLYGKSRAVEEEVKIKVVKIIKKVAWAIAQIDYEQQGAQVPMCRK